MASNETLREVVDELSAALGEYDRLTFDEVQSRELGPPASQAQIRRAEKALGTPLPPSYKAFLELHNGWSNLAGASKLLAADDHGSEWVKRQMDYWDGLADNQPNPFKAGAIPVLIGENENSFLVMDPATRRPDGEMDFVMYDYMHEEARFENLESFLRRRLKILRMLIERRTKGAADDAYDN